MAARDMAPQVPMALGEESRLAGEVGGCEDLGPLASTREERGQE